MSGFKETMCDIGHIVIEMKHAGNPVKICSFQAGSFEIDFKREEIHLYHCQCSSKCKNVECCNKCDKQPNQTCRGNIMSHQCNDAITNIRIVSKECYKIENSTDNTVEPNRVLSRSTINKEPCTKNQSPCARTKVSNTPEQGACNNTTRCQNSKNLTSCNRATERDETEQQICQNKFRDNCWPSKKLETKNLPCAPRTRSPCVKNKQRAQSPCNTKYKDTIAIDKQSNNEPCGPKTLEHSTVQCQLKKAYLQNNPPQTQYENKTRKQTDENALCRTRCSSTPTELKTLDKCNFQIKIEPKPADKVNWQRKQKSNEGRITFQSNDSDINLYTSREQSGVINEPKDCNLLNNLEGLELDSYQRESMTEPSCIELLSTKISNLRKISNQEIISCQSVNIDKTRICRDTLINDNGDSFIRCQVTVPDCQSVNIIDKPDKSKPPVKEIKEWNAKDIEDLGSDDEYDDCQ